MVEPKKMISCCGVVCSECSHYPEDCGGCPEIHGKAFWLQYTGGQVCEIYDCCIGVKKLPHCGLCSELPCSRYDGLDPTKTPEENQEDFVKQLNQLRSMQAQEYICPQKGMKHL